MEAESAVVCPGVVAEPKVLDAEATPLFKADVVYPQTLKLLNGTLLRLAAVPIGSADEEVAETVETFNEAADEYNTRVVALTPPAIYPNKDEEIVPKGVMDEMTTGVEMTTAVGEYVVNRVSKLARVTGAADMVVAGVMVSVNVSTTAEVTAGNTMVLN